MDRSDTVIAVFADHLSAEGAIKSLCQGGFEIRNLSIIGKGFHTEEKVVGFYNAGDRIRFWGSQGAFWGGFWGLFLGGAFISLPVVGHVIILGALAAAVVAAVEGALVLGGLSVLGAALYSVGIPKDTILQYEAALKADGFLVMAHGSASEMARAKALLVRAQALDTDIHSTPTNHNLPVALARGA